MQVQEWHEYSRGTTVNGGRHEASVGATSGVACRGWGPHGQWQGSKVAQPECLCESEAGGRNGVTNGGESLVATLLLKLRSKG
ncbi:hypothetical protein WISP_41179 [Willisornis vidua]|uniref:Uncharacterized protein n=1 Tax=Willisornis vidua TaxID=1566151 RepID=A0ABQ9DGZ8_9PASS|nr:hypothetical protein WISP_41179 [Willisornis vidua]